MFELGPSNLRTVATGVLWGWRGRPTPEERPPIFLHFLNRELWRSLGKNIPVSISRKALVDFFLCTTSKFFAPLDFIWESGVFSANQEPLLIEMINRGEIDILSRHSTPDEFVYAKQEMYKHDRIRYPMYFLSHDRALETVQPTVMRSRSATSFIEQNLLTLSQRMYTHQLPPMPIEDAEPLLTFQRSVQDVISHRDGAAITLSLFENSADFQAARFAIARLLSLLHTEDYLEYYSGDVLTGIKGLSYFDRCSRNWPYYDAVLFSSILDAMEVRRERLTDLTERLLVDRHGYLHRSFCRYVRFLIHVFFLRVLEEEIPRAVLEDKSALISHIRSLICDEIKRVFSNITYKQRRYVSKSIMDDLTQRIEYAILVLSRDPKYKIYVEAERDKMLASIPRVLVVTASDIERDTFIREATAVSQLEPQQLFFRDHTVFSLGVVGGVEVGMVRIEQGSLESGASTLAIVDVIDDYQPTAVIMAGICFGLKQDKQTIGDILVSTQIQGYEHRKVTDSSGVKKVHLRGGKPPASQRLLDRCRAAEVGWSGAEVHSGLILSGNVLSDAKEVVQELKQLAPEAIGAEMEGTGLYASSMKRKVDWILIKAICDWGYDKADDHQKAAAKSVVDFVLRVIQQGGLAVLGSSGR